jgi:hypothetical protein
MPLDSIPGNAASSHSRVPLPCPHRGLLCVLHPPLTTREGAAHLGLPNRSAPRRPGSIGTLEATAGKMHHANRQGQSRNPTAPSATRETDTIFARLVDRTRLHQSEGEKTQSRHALAFSARISLARVSTFPLSFLDLWCDKEATNRSCRARRRPGYRGKRPALLVEQVNRYIHDGSPGNGQCVERNAW